MNFTNLKTLSGYIAKSKPQGICLQLSRTPGGDYAIWPKYDKGNKYILIESFTNAPYLRVYLSYKKHKYLFLKEEKKKKHIYNT